MKLFKKTINVIFFIFLISFLSVVAVEFTPQGNINGRGVYGIYNFTTINGTILYQNGNQVIDSSSITNQSSNYSSFANSSTYWDGETSQSNLNVNSSDYWDNLTNQSQLVITESQISDLTHTTDTNTQKGTSGIFLYNDSTNIFFNDTLLNDTIDARDSSTIYTNGTDISLVGTTFSLIQGVYLKVVDFFTKATGTSGYLYNDSTTIYFNETKLNDTIDDRDADTTYTAGAGLNLAATTFSHNDSSSQGSSDNSGRTYIQDITLDTYGHLTGLATATETVVDTTIGNCSVTNSCSNIAYDVEINKSYVDTQDITFNDSMKTYVDNTFITQANEGNLNVNSSDYWDNLNSPSDINAGDITDDNTYVTVSGDTMTGALNMSTNPIYLNGITLKPLDQKNPNIAGPAFGMYMTGPSGQNLPHLILSSGGPTQATTLLRSMMIVNEIAGFHNTTNATDCTAYMNEIGETLKIDCNTTTTGADLLVGDDLQVVGDLWNKDTDGDWHFLTRTLTELDNLYDDILFNRLDMDVTGTNLSFNTTLGDTIIVNLNTSETITTMTSDSITLTAGTNLTPVRNIITYQTAGNPSLVSSTTTPTADHANVADVMLGTAGNIYGAIFDGTNNYEFIKKVYERFLDEGAIYKTGFSIGGSATQLNISSGTLKSQLQSVTTSLNLSIQTDGFFWIEANGNFMQSTTLDVFTNYSDGTPITALKFYNVVYGVVPISDSEARIMAVVQDYPSDKPEYGKLKDAEVDKENKVLLFPSNSFLKNIFIPVARVIYKKGTASNQLLSNGNYFFDVRGQTGISGGSPPAPSITDHGNLDGLADDDHTLYLLANGTRALTGNWDVGNFDITLQAINADDWTNVTILESQVTDLVHTTDTNASTACSGGQVLFGNGTCGIAIDTDTTYTAGTGLSLGGGAFSWDTTYGDARYYTQSTADSTFITQANEGNLNVNHSDFATDWAGVTSFQTKWLSDSANVLTFDEAELNTSIEAYGYSTTTGTVTAVTGAAPITSTGGTTPEIGITVAKDLVTTAPLTGGTNNILTGSDSDITIAIPVATSIADGYLSQTDWSTFNNKQSALTFGIANGNAVDIDSSTVASGEYAKFTANGLESKSFAEVRADLDLEAGTDFYSKTAEDTWRNSVTQTEMGYLNGVSSDIQTQLNTKGDMNDLIDDTTPQLGGNLDTNGNNITGTNNQLFIRFGNNICIFTNSTGLILYNNVSGVDC